MKCLRERFEDLGLKLNFIICGGGRGEELRQTYDTLGRAATFGQKFGGWLWEGSVRYIEYKVRFGSSIEENHV